jgi:hypothetical protein
MKINDAEFKQKLQEFIVAQGPVQGSGMAATWAWKVQKERQFIQTLRDRGELEEDKEGS